MATTVSGNSNTRKFKEKMDDDDIFKPTPSKSKKPPAKKEQSLNDWYRSKMKKMGLERMKPSLMNLSMQVSKYWIPEANKAEIKSERPI